MRANILIGFLLIFIFLHANAQDQKVPVDITKAEFKQLKKRVKHLSLEEKLSALTLLLSDDNNSYSLKTLATKKSDISSNPRMSQELRFKNLSMIKELGPFPFPSLEIRSSSELHLPVCLPAYFNSDYLIDLPEDATDFLWGVDTSDNTATLYPYPLHDWTSALWSHDMILLSGHERIPESIFQTKLKKKSRQKLDQKLIQNMVSESASALTAIDTSGIYQYIWDAYAQNKVYNDNLMPDLDTFNAIYVYQPSDNFSKFITTLQNYYPIESLSSQLNTLDFTYNDLIIYPRDEVRMTDSVLIDKLSKDAILLLLDFNQPDSRIRHNQNTVHLELPEDNWLIQTLTAQQLSRAYNKRSEPVKLLNGPSEMVGINYKQLESMDSIIRHAIEEKAMPGCQVLVAKDNMIVWNKSYGYQTYDSIRPVTKQTRYDLASLTKPLATTQAMMKLVDNSLVDLDEPLSTYLGYLKETNKANITSRQVLSHQAGLYSYFPFWKKAMNEIDLSEINDSVQVASTLFVDRSVADSIRSWVAYSDLLADRIDTISHEQYWYSDVGFYLLQDLIEVKTGMPLDQYLDRNLYKPLGTGLRFRPLDSYKLSSIAPTEDDLILRNELIQGFVHDRNAALKGGVAGHSGLFGNANDVAIMLQLQLNLGSYGGVNYFSAGTINEFTRRHYTNNRRGLGWDMPGPEPDGPVSLMASPATIGHTGFTGVSIWADPEENLIFVFLSNRIYPSVENNKLIEENIRTRIQDIVYGAIQYDKRDD